MANGAKRGKNESWAKGGGREEAKYTLYRIYCPKLNKFRGLKAKLLKIKN